MTDRLDLANAFEGAGFERKAAERVAAEIFDAIRENVATKADLAELRAALSGEFAAVRAELQSEIAAVRVELRSEIAAVRVELRSEIVAVRAELRSETAAGKADILKWMFAQTAVTIGGLAALFHLLH
jgi:head-tail adaptor